jgi:hypothetical protein
MPAEEVAGGGRRFGGAVSEVHVGFGHCAPAFVPVTGRARRDQVFPAVRAASVARNDVVNGQVGSLPAAILASVVVAAEYFTFVQLDVRARPVNDLFQADDRGPRIAEPGQTAMDAPGKKRSRFFLTTPCGSLRNATILSASLTGKVTPGS